MLTLSKLLQFRPPKHPTEIRHRPARRAWSVAQARRSNPFARVSVVQACEANRRSLEEGVYPLTGDIDDACVRSTIFCQLSENHKKHGTTDSLAAASRTAFSRTRALKTAFKIAPESFKDVIQIYEKAMRNLSQNLFQIDEKNLKTSKLKSKNRPF